MTDKQLKRLKRLELLEIMIAQDKELEALRERNKELEERLKLLREILEKYMKNAEKGPEPEAYRDEPGAGEKAV